MKMKAIKKQRSLLSERSQLYQMKIVSYGVIDSSETIDSLIGTKGIRIYNIPYRDIGMVISGSDRSSMKVNNNDNTPDYKIVVEHLMQKFTVLPIRFRTPVSK